jgi:hypothetical protein
MVYGTVKAQSLESYGWGMASSIMGMIPISPFGFICFVMFFMGILLNMILDEGQGYAYLAWMILVMAAQLGIGVWNLIILLQPEVVEGFEYEPE